MKLRLHGNSLRLRLSQRDATSLLRTGCVEEFVQFAPGLRLRYAIESSSTLDAPRADFTNNCILVLLPRRQVDAWLTSDEIGISAEQGGGTGPALLIEKDFRYLFTE